MGHDGSYYEGEWKNGERNGWGFSIAPKKPLRVGEWKKDKYKGERLVYTSQRIYGIDISKHQHIKGRKRYQINWKETAHHASGKHQQKNRGRQRKLPDPLHLHQEHRG